MAKKNATVVTDGIVNIPTDAEKLAALRAIPAVPPLPTPPTETPVTPTPATPVTPQAILAAFQSDPTLVEAVRNLLFPQGTRTRQAFNSGVAGLVPRVRKSMVKQGYVEFEFTDKPDEATREDLKAHFFRWSMKNSVWYGPADKVVNHATFGPLVQQCLSA